MAQGGGKFQKKEVTMKALKRFFFKTSLWEMAVVVNLFMVINLMSKRIEKMRKRLGLTLFLK